jgi:hypothetical protein
MLLCSTLYSGAYVVLGVVAGVQRKRVIEWFRQWNPELAARELPVGLAADISFLFSKRAREIMRPHQFLCQQRRRFVVLAIACLAMFAAFPVVFLILALCLGLI